jgi:hypothetical protein
MSSFNQPLTSKFTQTQFDYIKAHPLKSALLRELLTAHIIKHERVVDHESA